LKRLIALIFVLIIALSMVTVSASPAGGTPLVSRRHLEGAVAESISEEVRQVLDSATNAALSRLDELYLGLQGFSYVGRFTPVSLTAGGNITIGPGASFIMLSGSSSLSINSGTVVNVSTGNVVSNGTELTLNHRFFCTENTTAVITASTAVSGLVDGFHTFDGATLAPPPPPQPPPQPPRDSHTFADVPANAWFAPAVDFVFRNNLFTGTSDTTFSPNTPMTRGMFVTVLHRLYGLPEVTGAAVFSDVRDPSAFFFDAVAWANAGGIVTGFTDGTFRPNDSVTREQMAAIMHRFAYHTDRSMAIFDTALDNFPDRSDISSFAIEPLQWAVSWQIIQGGTGGRLLPRNTATRAEVAQIILNYNNNVILGVQS